MEGGMTGTAGHAPIYFWRSPNRNRKAATVWDVCNGRRRPVTRRHSRARARLLPLPLYSTCFRMPRLTLIFASLTSVAALGYCNDVNPSCGSWSLQGECEGENAEHVKKLCPHSCGVCNFMCGDMEESCASWAKQGECESAPAYMHKSEQPRPMPSACRSHYDPETVPAVPRACPHLAPPTVRPGCPTACGLCAPKCADIHTDCNHWMKDGQCEENPGYMNKHCAVS